MPAISVVIPVYNAAAFLPRCLESLIGQTYRDIEIICVDDGSSDDSLEVLRQYAARDARIKVIHQENSGVSAARNAGLDVATGEYVTFVDADDWVEPDTYGNALAYVPDDADLICFGSTVEALEWRRPQDEMQDALALKCEGKMDLTPDNLYKINGCVWNKIFVVKKLNRYGIRFFEGVSHGEDAAFVYCVCGSGGCVWCVPGKWYHYLMHEKSATSGSGGSSLRLLTHLSCITRVSHFYARIGLGIKGRPWLIKLFEHSYTYVRRQIDASLVAAVDVEAFRVAEEVGLLVCRESRVIRSLLSRTQSRLCGFFRYFRGRSVSYGLFGYGVWSITYEPGMRVYRFMGMVVWTSIVTE